MPANGHVMHLAHNFASSLELIDLATETEQAQFDTRLVQLDEPATNEITQQGDKYPWLEHDDPRRTMTNNEILQNKIKLHNSALPEERRLDLYDRLEKKGHAFSLRDEIGTCPYFEVHLQLRNEDPFFVRPYPIREEQKAVVEKEMNRLEQLGIIRKGLTGYSSPVLLVKRKEQKLYRVVTDFRVLNERLVRINHAFPLVRDCLDAIGSSDCDVMSVLDLRDAYHTLRLAERFAKVLRHYTLLWKSNVLLFAHGHGNFGIARNLDAIYSPFMARTS